jgi:hypothetical protein
VAALRASEARSRAARAEYPLARTSLEDALASYNARTEEMLAATAELQAALNRAGSLYSAAGLSDSAPNDHPRLTIASLTPVAKAVRAKLQDYR